MTRREHSTPSILTAPVLALMCGSMAALVVFSPALSASPSQNVLISACYNKATHTLQKIAVGGVRCGSGESVLTWNQQGPRGPQGAPGPAGTAGPQGSVGVQGPKGDTGATGPQGPQGPQGPRGDAGAQGLIGFTGPMGPAGPQGATGPTGPEGPSGAQGPKGDPGDVGMRWRGQWSAGTTYAPRDAVEFNGSSWIAVITSYSAQPDTSPLFWQLFAAHGEKGATGATGAQGEKGSTGATGAQGEKGATGATGPQGATGATGPQGAKGDQGPKGDPGGLAGLQYLKHTFTGLTNSVTTANVACPSGTRVIGGGYSMDPLTSVGVTVFGSWPEDATHWSVYVAVVGTMPRSITVYAVCASAAGS